MECRRAYNVRTKDQIISLQSRPHSPPDVLTGEGVGEGTGAGVGATKGAVILKSNGIGTSEDVKNRRLAGDVPHV